jgi:opacity protein-like surface antigen
MKRLVLAGALAAIALGQALASDLLPPAPVPPHVRLRLTCPQFLKSTIGAASISALISVTASAPAIGATPAIPGGTTGNFNLRGFLSGATLGVNFQTDSFIYGAEGDFDGSFIDGKIIQPVLRLRYAMRDWKFLVFRPCAHGSVMRLIESCSMAPPTVRWATLHPG